MRQIQAQSGAITSTQRHGGAHRDLPSTGVYIPNYKGVNQVLYQAGGNGQIQFMTALANMGQNYMEQQQALYDKMEVAKSVASADIQYRQESEKFLRENPTAKGYTDFITAKYDEIFQASMAQASNANVKNSLQMMFTSRKADIANNAFQKEKEIYTGYATSETTNQLSAICNEVMVNPGEVASLTDKYSQQLSSMENIMSSVEYEKYKTSKMQEFVYSYGLGLINKDPYTAQELVKGSGFSESLAPEKFHQLQILARGEITYRMRKAKEYNKMVQMEQLKQQVATCDELYGKMVLGNCSEADIKGADISNKRKLELLEKLKNVNAKRDKAADHETQIAKALDDKDHRLSKNVTNKEIEDFAVDYFEGEMKKGTPLSLAEKAQYFQNHKNVYSFAIPSFENAVYHDLKKELDPNKILGACVVIQGSENCPAMKNIAKDRSAKDFSTWVYELYKGAKNLDAIKIARDEWFQATPQTIKDNEEKWKEITKVTRFGKDNKRELLSEFYKDNGYDDIDSWFKAAGLSGPDRQRIDDNVFNIMHRVYKQCGNIVTAKTVAKVWLQQHVVKDPVTDKFTFDPPTVNNTRFTNTIALKEHISQCKKDALKKAINRSKDWKASDVYLEKVSDTEPVYRFYILDNPDDPNARTYLIDETYTSITVNVNRERKK